MKLEDIKINLVNNTEVQYKVETINEDYVLLREIFTFKDFKPVECYIKVFKNGLFQIEFRIHYSKRDQYLNEIVNKYNSMDRLREYKLFFEDTTLIIRWRNMKMAPIEEIIGYIIEYVNIFIDFYKDQETIEDAILINEK